MTSGGTSRRSFVCRDAAGSARVPRPGVAPRSMVRGPARGTAQGPCRRPGPVARPGDTPPHPGAWRGWRFVARPRVRGAAPGGCRGRGACYGPELVARPRVRAAAWGSWHNLGEWRGRSSRPCARLVPRPRARGAARPRPVGPPHPGPAGFSSSERNRDPARTGRTESCEFRDNSTLAAAVAPGVVGMSEPS